MKIRIPRTANEMYHLRDAAPIERSELKNGDLVFFRTQGRGTADHVACMSATANLFSHRAAVRKSRSHRSAKITATPLCRARRVMTPKTIPLKLTLLLTQQGKFIFCLTF